ncbi:MAG: efflux RND transporter permease subunit, partial [Clostridiales Family XIII bacterium]|nr:efflux RND transporter permease subunit [Clostridiales Family XIII bacterium]
MGVSRTAVNRPVTTLMLLLIVAAFGIISYTRLPLDLFPKMDLPMQVVMTNYPNAAPNEIETMVTKPLEQQVATAENLSGITSYSMDGTSIIIAQFESGSDMNFAGLDIREKVELVGDYLPDEASKPMVIAMNPDMLPIQQLYVSADMDMSRLNALVEEEIVPAIERVEGVASVNSFGGKEEEISVELNQAKLDGYHLTLMQVQQALAAENVSLPSGEVKKGSRDMIVRTVGNFETIDDVKNVSLPLPTNEIVHVGDVANVVRTEGAQTTIGRVDGNPAIGVAVNKQTVANTVQVSDRIETVMDDLEERFPELRFTMALDQSEFVKNSISFVAESAIMGCILAVLVCLFFLRNIASTLIIAVSIPTSIVATFILMYFAGFTMNMLSLSGLAVGIGMLVDDAIVVMENVFRRRAGGLSPRDSAIKGTAEVTAPVFTATMTKIAVFLPIVFVEGIAATIFKEFSFTISFALACSLVVALTIIPMLCSKLIRIGDISDLGDPELDGADLKGHPGKEYYGEGAVRPAGDHGTVITGAVVGAASGAPTGAEVAGSSGTSASGDVTQGKTAGNMPPRRRVNPGVAILSAFGAAVNKVIAFYVRVVRFALVHRKTVVALCVALLVTSAGLIAAVGGELFPETDESSLTINAEVPNGTPIEKIDEIMMKVEDYAANEIEGVKDYSLSIGNTSIMSLGGGSNTASLTVNLVDKDDRNLSSAEIAAKAESDLSVLPGVKIDAAAASSMNMGGMGAGSAINIQISGDEFDELEKISDEIVELVDKVPGTVKVASSIEEGSPEVRVTPDRAISAAYGVSAYQIAQTLNSALSGATATNLNEDGTEIPVKVRLNGAYGESIENMENIAVVAPTGQTVYVGDIADVELANSPSQIMRSDQNRVVTISGELDGRDLQSVTDDITAQLDAYDMPRGYSYEIGGEAEEMMSSFTQLIYALLLSLVIVYMILAAQFESLVQPFIIMLAIPFALTGAFIGLFIANTPLSLVAFIGIIMLAGIVVNNSILLIDFINRNRAVY